MASKFLQAFIGNAHYENERLLPRVQQHAATLKDVLIVCQNFRIAGIATLLLFAESAEFRLSLFKSGRAFAHYCRGASDEAKVTSRARPFFDAIAVLDFDGAEDIALHSKRVRSDVEYHEDFLYMDFLMAKFFSKHADPAAILAAYEQALGGADDPRLDVCRALAARDATLFHAALFIFIADVQRRYARLREREVAVEEELETEGRLCIEALALINLAERDGIPTQTDYPLVPSLARVSGPPQFAADVWLTP